MKIENLKMSYGPRILYENVNININARQHIGVVGDNGAGKSTLFKIINKEIIPDEGNVILNNEIIAILPQVIELSKEDEEMTVLDYLLSARPIEKLQTQLTDCYNKLSESNLSNQKKIYNKINKLEDKLLYYDVYEAESILLKIIEGMGINPDILSKKVRELSGGKKSQVSFARLLYSKAHIILLDEPTNHLDEKSRNYIINYLKNYHSIVFVISHDISFLNEVTNKTLYVDKTNKSIRLYNGNYDSFMKTLTLLRENTLKKQNEELKEKERLERFINKYNSVSGKRKKMVKDREKKLERLLETRNEEILNHEYTNIPLEICSKGNDIPVSINNITFHYPNTYIDIIKNLSLQISFGERFLIVGQNGVGKSTLLKLIVNQLQPQKGDIKIGNKMKVGYYAQEHEIINNNISIIDNFKDIDIDEDKLRSVLANFLFYADDINKKVAILSPGERSRVALCKILVSPHNMLVLDEPTNHLDPQTSDIVAKSFQDYEGTMLLVSHNKSFIKKLNIERCLLLPEGKIINYDEKKIFKEGS